jgi:hypothetical protein
MRDFQIVNQKNIATAPTKDRCMSPYRFVESKFDIGW